MGFPFSTGQARPQRTESLYQGAVPDPRRFVQSVDGRVRSGIPVAVASDYDMNQ